MSYSDIAEQLPAGVEAEQITQHVPLRSTRPSALGELHLVIHDGTLLVLSRRSALRPMERVTLDLAYPPELVRDARFAHGLRLVTADGETHTLRISEQENEGAARLLQTASRLPPASTAVADDAPGDEGGTEVALTNLDNVFIAVPWGRPTIDLVRAMQHGVESLATRSSSPVALLLVVLRETRVPEDKTRRAARAMFSSLGQHVAAMAVVFDGTGFAVAAKRSIFSLVSSKMLGTIERKIFKDPESASAWLVQAAAAKGCVCPDAALLSARVQQEIDRIRAAGTAS